MDYFKERIFVYRGIHFQKSGKKLKLAMENILKYNLTSL